ncbi:hypothetical protein [Agrilutibacter solisilvae]|uniref:Uncharacterized protein n=1 Tax=Agrilutibacter solisilvae TaxID=2763317 RepID=A0A974XYE2_9GAMM|nr:hypothetical protein [Lysobacter solisilvae]QSX78066.1 hypothetical protein I8J32_015365 [Lysobacter solisilvae]
MLAFMAADGSTLAFLSPRDNSGAKLHLLPMAGGEATTLTCADQDLAEPAQYPWMANCV